MKCPYCGSEDVQYATRSYGGGGSLSGSCCGYMIFGPLGILCGQCNSGVKTEEFWVCHSCGAKFSDFEAQVSSGIEELKQDRIVKKEEARQKAIAEAKAAKEKYNAYKVEVAEIEAVPGAITRIRAEYNIAKENRLRIRDEQENYLKQGRHCDHRDIRKAAKRLKSKPLLTIFLWILMGMGFICIAEDLWLFGFALMVIAGLCLSSISASKKKAHTDLISLDPQYASITKRLNEALNTEKILKEKIDKSEYVKTYEKEKLGKADNATAKKRGKYER